MSLLVWYFFASVIWETTYAQPAELYPSVDPNHYGADGNPCYDRQARSPQRCVPDFINAAFNLQVDVTNTCGVSKPINFCVQSGHTGQRSVCESCDARHPDFSHPSKYLTDFNVGNNETWWQSETMMEGMQYPTSVNLTLVLGKKFDITYVRLKFISPRPESFTIYKKTEMKDDWVPWQYYSGSCRATYGLPDRAPILPGNEAVAQCTKEFSDISPITGGNIAFSTLEGRPSSHAFESSEVLQKWVTASAIRISLNRMNTFGDEVFRDPQVLRSYYYAISDFAVGGRCKCNGHASECVGSSSVDGENRLVCRCEHNTHGEDCNECLPFYNDRPWRSGDANEANECVACNCSQLSNRCYFDQELFDETGHGGHCIDCQGNTQGVHCEQCIENHWRRPGDNYCVACGCNEIGSLTTQCDAEGKCQCKPGVTGRYCDQCMDGYFDFSPNGCKDCGCEKSGSLNNQPRCDPTTGSCTCKLNVEGRQCEKCKPGYFDLSEENHFGCTPCFCFGHSSVCSTADGYFAMNVSSVFDQDKQKWSGFNRIGMQDAQWSELDKAVAVSDIDNSPVYFVAPEQFNGDQRSSYNQYLVFTLKVSKHVTHQDVRDVVIVGSNGQELSISITAQQNPFPSTSGQTYRFRIHADPRYGWYPRINELDFIGILSNISSIRIRGTYSYQDVGFLSNVHLGTAGIAPSATNPKQATWIEHCECLPGFVGQFCESCEPGFRREVKFGGSFNRCIKCDCHNHSNSCEAESGSCICEHNTSGDTCERCSRGYYGDALQGTPEDCQKCPCPNDGPCILHSDGDVLCTECPNGYTGRRCDECSDGYFGNPKESIECRECECSGNTDPNSIGNCDKVSGECKKCVFNTHGFNCEKCKPGYWGDALIEPKGNCQSCGCYAAGTSRPNETNNLLECNQEDGQCDCLPNVIGIQCDQCSHGYYNITSGLGCEECNCDPLGSEGNTCDVVTGQCECKPGVTGKRCDQCAPYHFGFSANGCQPCDCEPIGSESPQCDVATGQCLCRQNVEGRRCDQCSENRYGITQGCLPCDDCYTLIQTRVNGFREKVSSLDNTLQEIIENPAPVNDTTFEDKVKEAAKEAQDVWNKVEAKIKEGGGKIKTKSKQIEEEIIDALARLNDIDGTIAEGRASADQSENDIRRWEYSVESARRQLEHILAYLENEGEEQAILAENANKKYGGQSDKLTKLAHDAQVEADKHLKQSEDIENVLQETIANVEETKKEASKIVLGGNANSFEIADLKNRYDRINDTLAKTFSLVEEQKEIAENANKDTALLLSNVEGTKIPNVDKDALREELNKINEESEIATETFDKEQELNKELFEEIERNIAEAQRELRLSRNNQAFMEKVLEMVRNTTGKAETSFGASEETLTGAKKALESLKAYKKKVEDSQNEANNEFEKSNSIIESIENLTEKANEIQRLSPNIQEVDEAKKRIADSAAQAEKAKENGQKEREVVGDVHSSAEVFQEDVEQFIEDLKETSDVIDQHKKEAEEDRQKAEEAVKRASVTQKSALDANETVLAKEEEVRKLLEQLNTLEETNIGELDELEEELNNLEKMLQDAGFANDIAATQQSHIDEETRILDLKKEIARLEREVVNLEEIRDNIPTDCYNVISLEQEGQ